MTKIELLIVVTNIFFASVSMMILSIGYHEGDLIVILGAVFTFLIAMYGAIQANRLGKNPK